MGLHSRRELKDSVSKRYRQASGFQFGLIRDKLRHKLNCQIVRIVR